jgi:peptidoglycan/LPS O-acetylase OafA/YrhL
MNANTDSEVRTVPRLVLLLVISIISFSLLNIFLLSSQSDPSIGKIFQRGFRFVFTCVLAYFLFRGAVWARWVVLVISVLSVIISIIGLLAIPKATPFFYQALFAIGGVFYGIVASLLLFSSSVVSHFKQSKMNISNNISR